MRNTVLRCAVAVAICHAGAASAGGLWLNTIGDSSGGRAGAGAHAGIDGAATVMHNPASATRIEGKQLFASAGVFLPDIKFKTDYSNDRLGYGDSGDAGVAGPLGSAAYVQGFGEDDRWYGGIYFGGLAGAGLDYDDDWVGRYQATDVNLLIAAIAPTISYRLTEQLSIGASLQYWYADLELKLRVPRLNPDAVEPRAKIDGDDSGFGYTLGVMYELTDRTRFGIHYQSELEPDFKGDLKIQDLDGPVIPGDELQFSSNTKMKMAQYVRLAMHHDLDEQWAVDLTIGWDDWSELGDVLLATDRGEQDIPTRWRDTYHYAWGAQYRLDQQWTFTGGVSYDTNPVGSNNRNAQLPVDRQLYYAFGAQYKKSDRFTIGGYVNYADLGSARISNGRWGGEYKDNAALILSLNANWVF